MADGQSEDTFQFVQKELRVIQAKCGDIADTELVACVPAMVRIHIKKTEHKQLAACFMFPDQYPQAPIVIELKSKALSDRLLNGLSRVCEEEAKKMQGQRQILPLVEFIKKFLEDNPLCVCSEDISRVKRKLLGPNDEIKLKQKSSQVVLKLQERGYFVTVKLKIPDNYPLEQTGVDISSQNLPEMLRVNFTSQAVELARQCVQPPLKKKPKDPPFAPKPSLYPLAEYFMNDVIQSYTKQTCPCCEKYILPDDPKNVVNDPAHPKFIERMYCGHLFHHDCLDKYMKTPPFAGGKKCPSCKNRIYHEKWKISPQLAETRWAHQEARRRELSEVVEFLE